MTASIVIFTIIILYFLYIYNLSVRKHINEQKKMYKLIKRIYENTK